MTEKNMREEKLAGESPRAAKEAIPEAGIPL